MAMSEVEWIKTFAGNLQSLMDERGYNQTTLAEDSYIPRESINRYLRGVRMPSVKAVVNIAYALDCDVADLMDFGDRIEM